MSLSPPSAQASLSQTSTFPIPQWPPLPSHLLPIFYLALATFHVLFLIVINWYPKRKQRSWLITLMGSGFMTLASTPFVWDFVRGGMSVAALEARSWLAERVCTIFLAYLSADLILGTFFYKEHLTLSMGWIHHSIYFLIVSSVIHQSRSHIFALCAAMELPTHLLALASLHPRFRSDIIFATSFFTLRIAFHIALLVQYILPSVRSKVLGGGASAWFPTVMLVLALPMHVIWFTGCVKGILRRARQKREMGKAYATPGVEKTLAFVTSSVVDPVALPPLSPPATPQTIPSEGPTLTLPRPPSILYLPALPTRAQLRRRLSKEGRAETIRRVGEQTREGLGKVWGRGRGVVMRVGAEVFGVEEREKEMRGSPVAAY